MTQTIGKIQVVTSSQPIANTQLNAVKVAVNPGNTQRVQTIAYSKPFRIADATDVRFDNTTNNLSVLTYDDITDEFVVQNVPRIDGGTF